MSIKLLTAGTLLALSAYVPNVHAWTLIAEGHVSKGIDTTGVFGTAGQDLSGLAYTHSIEIGTARSEWDFALDRTGQLMRVGHGPAYTMTITIKGETFTFAGAATENGNQGVHINRYSEGIYSSTIGKQTNGGTLRSYFQVTSDTDGFLPSLSYSQAISQNTSGASFVTRESSFGTNTEFLPGLPTVYFSGAIENFTVIPSPIPEPATYGLLIAGLGILAMISRRKNKLHGTGCRKRPGNYSLLPK